MARPLIQLALDSLDNATTFKLATLAAPYVDILEIGTPNIKADGLPLVKELKKKFPACRPLLASSRLPTSTTLKFRLT